MTGKERMISWRSLPEPKPSWESFKMMLLTCNNDPSNVLRTWRKIKVCDEVRREQSNNGTFLSTKDLSDVADEVAVGFEFNFCSTTPLGVIASCAKEILEDREMPTRWSLCLAIAKLAKAKWSEKIFQTKKEILELERTKCTK